MNEITEINELDLNTREGRLALALLARLQDTVDTGKKYSEIIEVAMTIRYDEDCRPDEIDPDNYGDE